MTFSVPENFVLDCLGGVWFGVPLCTSTNIFQQPGQSVWKRK